MLFGAHQSVAGGLDRAFSLATDDGCEAIQVFTKNSNAWREPVVSTEALDAFRAARDAWTEKATDAARKHKPVVFSHASYLINLCANSDVLLERSREALYAELCRCDALGVDYVVLHPGAHVGLGEDLGIERIADSLGAVLARTRGQSTRLCIENMAGQGTTLGFRLDQIGAMIERTGAEGARLGVCIDTQHAFAAGYDLRSDAGYSNFWSDFDRFIGADRLAGFHLNDSKCDLGANVDRHEHIGKGEIGTSAFWRLANDPRFATTPGVLETAPVDGNRAFLTNLNVLRALVGAAEPKRVVRAFVLTSPSK